jgi:hypothetical protein
VQKGYDVATVKPEEIAEVIAFALSRPRHLAINEILLRPASQLGQHGNVCSPRRSPLGRQAQARQDRPPGHPPEHQGTGPRLACENPDRGIARSTVTWPAWERR